MARADRLAVRPARCPVAISFAFIVLLLAGWIVRH
jgi:hypothetical protein